jgi:hypothetical protein
MSQTSYSQTFVKGKEGMKADSRRAIPTTLLAAVTIPLARGVFKMYGQEQRCRLPVENQSVILDDAGTFTAGNIVTTVNDTAITTTFGTNKATTMTAHAAAIQAGVTDVYSAVYSDGSHTITIKSRNTSLVVTVSVAGITGTMTITSITATSLDVIADFRGAALDPGTLVQDANGLCQMVAGDAINVMEQGAIYLYPEEAVTSDDDVYVRIQANGVKLPGMFGTSADSGKCIAVTGAKWAEGGSTTVLAKLVLNLPQ